MKYFVCVYSNLWTYTSHKHVEEVTCNIIDTYCWICKLNSELYCMEFYKLMLMISVSDWVFFLLFFFLFMIQQCAWLWHVKKRLVNGVYICSCINVMYLTIKLFIVFNPLLLKLIDCSPLPWVWLKKHCKYL